MKAIRILPALAAVLLGTSAAGFTQTKIDRTLEPFSTLIVRGPVKVELIPVGSVGREEKERIQVTLWDLDPKDFSAKVTGNILEISTRKGMVNKFAFADVKLYYKTLNRITSSGGDLKASVPIVSSSLILEAESSTGKMDLAVEANDVSVVTSGDNTIRLIGTTGVASYHAKFGSRIDCLHLESGNVDATATGKGEISLNSLKLLNARATTGGNIFYTGNPEALLIRKSFGGGVESVSNRK